MPMGFRGNFLVGRFQGLLWRNIPISARHGNADGSFIRGRRRSGSKDGAESRLGYALGGWGTAARVLHPRHQTGPTASRQLASVQGRQGPKLAAAPIHTCLNDVRSVTSSKIPLRLKKRRQSMGGLFVEGRSRRGAYRPSWLVLFLARIGCRFARRVLKNIPPAILRVGDPGALLVSGPDG